MRSSSIVIVALLTVLGLALPPTGIAGSGSDDRQAQTYIVGFHEMPGERGRYQGGQVLDASEALSFLVVRSAEPDAFERRVKQDPHARYLELDHTDWELALTPNDALYGEPGHYGTQITDAESAWDATTGSTAVVVAMVDSGIAAGHEDFQSSRILDGWDYVNDDPTPEDSVHCSYHGSHTTGTAGATIDNGVGIAGLSQHAILSQKIFHGKNPGMWGCEGATTSRIAEAITDAADKGAHLSSHSWGGGGSSTALNDAIAYADARGTVHVAAAGNSGSCTDCVSQPWKDNAARTVVVSCSDEKDRFCSFSSQGSEVDVMAPGYKILSVDGGGGYQEMSGTSMSTPHVTGALALYIDAHGHAPVSALEDALAASAEDLGLSSARQGVGRLNVGALVTGSSGGSTNTTNSAPTADFTFSCTDLSCDFDASTSSDSDGSIASYAWDLGDGAAATGQTASHTYASDGDYTVTLTVTDDDGATDTTSQLVSVSSGSTDTGGTTHVHDVDHSTRGPHLYIDVWIHDDAESPVSGATVAIEVCDSSNTCATGSGTTDDAGQVGFRWHKAGSGTYTTCVTSVTHDVLTWDGSADHGDDGSCETETV